MTDLDPEWLEQTVEDEDDETGSVGKRMPYLVVVAGKDRGRRYRVEERSMTVGRWPEADILIHDERISRVHCLVELAFESDRRHQRLSVQGGAA